MRHFVFGVFILISLATSLVDAKEADSSQVFASSLKEFIESLEVGKQKWQGGAIAILHKGRVIYKTTFGYQKGKKGRITPHTLFPLASVSKPVAAMALALMVENKTLSLEKELRYPCLQDKITLTHLLSHTTGFFFRGDQQIERGFTRARLIKALQQETPKCEIGQCYFYSNITFSLVEELLNSQRSSLKKAIQLLNAKLKTQDIRVLPLSSKVTFAYAHANRRKNAPMKALPFPSHYVKTVPASAGIYASLEAMIKFFKLSFGYRPDLLSRRTLEKFQRPYIKNNDIYKWSTKMPCPRKTLKSFYGLGWRILETSLAPSKKLIFHSGYIAGVNTFIGYIPAEEMGIIILANQSGFSTRKGLEFWGLFLK